MRIYQDGQQIVQAAHVRANRTDDWLTEVIAIGQDAGGKKTTFRFLLSRREVRHIAEVTK